MRKIIKSKNIIITEELENYINKKIDSLNKLIKSQKEEEERKTLNKIIVEVERETRHHEKGSIFKAEMILDLPGKTLCVKSVSENLNRSILKAKQELEEDIKRHKRKIVSLKRRKERALKRETKFSSAAKIKVGRRIREEGL